MMPKSGRNERARLAVAAVILSLACLLRAPARGDDPGFAPASATRGEPVLAVEDTLPPEISETLREVLVTARRETLDEILRHVAEGEAERDSLIDDQACTLFMRMTGRDSPEEPVDRGEPYFETVARIYQKRPGKQRVVTLRQWSREHRGGISGEYGSEGDASDEKTERGIRVSVDADMSEQFVAFAFNPRMRSHFRFKIEERRIIGDQVIYRIAFMPRSAIELLPTGRVWVNTNDFVILREEFAYTDRSPAPLFMESLDSCILERVRMDGRHWVLSRVLARVTVSDPARWFGKAARTRIPKVADFVIRWDDWAINQGIPDSLFVPASGEKKP